MEKEFTTSFKETSNIPARAKQTPSKVLLVARKKATTAAVRSLRAKIVIGGNSK